ncbi:MAG: fumarylacetoacetase [Saprospiraceae bacterium]
MQELKSWLPIPENSDFSLYNLPFGVFREGNGSPRAGVAIGDRVIDMVAAAEADIFGKKRFYTKIFAQDTLNEFIAMGRAHAERIRRKLQQWLCAKEAPEAANRILKDRAQVAMLLPIRIGDYTDFYSSIEHATNVGKMFRPDNPLLPNWRWLPVAYHGRASSIVVSGTPFRRPAGQTTTQPDQAPQFGPTRQLDFELEVAFVIGKDSPMGMPIDANEAPDYIFGLMLFNDWSARDIQRWEYVPLGPFLGKNFCSTVSPWIVTLDALRPFRVKGPIQRPEPLPYLTTRGPNHYDIELEVWIKPENGQETCVCRSNFRYLYWSMAQQLAHHTSNGCNVRVGDLMASGTISGDKKNSYGSLLELTWGGKNPLTLYDDVKRTFLEDGDTVILRGSAGSGSRRVGFGEAAAVILPHE